MILVHGGGKMTSILTSIKKLLGIAAEDTSFDGEIIIYINTAFMSLNQLGIGPAETPVISSKIDTWSSAFGDMKDIEAIKTYVYLKVRLVFDPPSSSFVIEAMNKQIAELEWRLNALVEDRKEV